MHSLLNRIAALSCLLKAGIDTVELKAKASKRIAEEGQRVKVSDTGH